MNPLKLQNFLRPFFFKISSRFLQDLFKMTWKEIRVAKSIKINLNNEFMLIIKRELWGNKWFMCVCLNRIIVILWIRIRWRWRRLFFIESNIHQVKEGGRDFRLLIKLMWHFSIILLWHYNHINKKYVLQLVGGFFS